MAADVNGLDLDKTTRLLFLGAHRKGNESYRIPICSDFEHSIHLLILRSQRDGECGVELDAAFCVRWQISFGDLRWWEVKRIMGLPTPHIPTIGHFRRFPIIPERYFGLPAVRASV
jgi:hypothetical protein